ncbi:hypothetical protein DFJ43DRAFT_1130593 [Lentinula guzmanii]|uniref:DNA polymerase n=1 Tax=Lentinula guzmanii TaxID=2804957 RepID=A0AA38JPV6_9AGAR|nr:hypothetical protein DFJ43DRAFT_1130593 [Lentinula guzmanii]
MDSLSPSIANLRVRINQIDYTLAPPGPLDNSTLPLVPILRIYGPSEKGTKACVHIHQVYPYFFVEYSGVLKANHVKQYTTMLKRSLNHAIALSLRKDPVSSKSRYIRSIILVKGVHFYGFHSSYSPFLKILVADPSLVSRIVAMMQNGTVMGTRFCIYESHLSYTLQFLSDFGLYGCGWIELGNALQRGHDENLSETSEDIHQSLFPISPHFRQSRMPLEIDAAAHQILNRRRLSAREWHHKLEIPAPPLPSDPLVLSVRELWEDERERRRSRGLNPSPEIPVDLSESSRGTGGGWVAEARYWDEISHRIAKEQTTLVHDNHDTQSWEGAVMTTFESIEALWEEEHRSWKPRKVEHDQVTSSNIEDTATVGSPTDEDSIDDESNIEDLPTEEMENIDEDEDEYLDRPFDDTPREHNQLEDDYDDDDDADDVVSEHGARSSEAEEPEISDWSRAKILTPSNRTYLYSNPPPSTTELLSTIEEFGLKSRIYRAPYYSDEKDAPLKPREYAGLVYHLKGGDGITHLNDWVSESSSEETRISTFSGDVQVNMKVGGWEYAGTPPSANETRKWLRSLEGQLKHTQIPKFTSRTQASLYELQEIYLTSFQIQGPTQVNKYGLKASPMKKDGSVSREKQDMSILSLEIFALSNAGRLPHAEENELVALFYTFQNVEDGPLIDCVACVDSTQVNAARLPGIALQTFSSELDLINSFVDIVIDLDPDIITGWDVQNSSWGYLAARARSFGLELGELLARAPPRYSSNNNIQWEARHTTTFKIAGRHVFNLWRIMRSEQTLNIYTFENVAFHVLGRRVPKYHPLTLTKWYQSQHSTHVATLIRYHTRRASLNIEILNQSEIVTKTAEFARVFGVDFYSVISRGSQFKVESFMFRMAKPESFVLISPSKSDVGKQNAAECLPLIMEPQSALYTSPLVVLDFQSLYPSLMISQCQNMCYSTCLGRVIDFQGRNKFGVVDLDRTPGLLEKLEDQINVAPNGIMFLKPNVRKGLLPRMLTELLDTRVMVKQAMKGYKHDRALTRVLNARQLGLKYIANVTYGYTSASFSGRMPAVEMADSIVQSGRETLEKAIALIHETKKWGAEVVYGDTDSMFIYMQGKTREQAFRIGYEIADTITALNPAPVKLKFEKVYHPCVLMAKKRYVGFKYENVDDKEPVFEAKGIETVRRDGILAQQKMTENCLKILFRTQDLSKVKEYCCDSWTKMLENRAPVQDFIFAKEVKMGTYSDKGPPPPGVAVAAKRTLLDPGDEPQYGERVPYVIVRGEPGSKLVDRAMDPSEFLRNPSVNIVLIPPLERIFNLVGADVRQWYNEMPRAKQIEVASPSKRGRPQVIELDQHNINAHFDRCECLLCGNVAFQGLCTQCRRQPQLTLAGLSNRIRSNEKRLIDTHKVCASCTGSTLDEAAQCESIDCSWLYARKRGETRIEFLEFLQDLVQGLADESDLVPKKDVNGIFS